MTNQDHNKARAERMAKEPRKKNKTQEREELFARMAKRAGAELPANPEDQNVPAPAPQDQNVPASVPETTEKKKKKLSPTVIAWRSKENLPLEGIIRLSDKAKAENPKKQGSKERFALYEDGMTVAAYIEKSKNAGHGAALAAADVRWDVVKGYITVE